MKKMLLSLAVLTLLLAFSSQSLAVGFEEPLLEFGEMDWGAEMMTDYSIPEGYGFDQVPIGFDPMMTPGLDVFSGAATAVLIFFLIIFLAFYVYFALAYSAIAKRTGTKRPWLAWIPVANLYLQSQIAQMHWWPTLMAIPLILFLLGMLFNLPFLTAVMLILSIISMLILIVFYFFWQYRIFERLGHPGWWALTYIIGTFTGMIIFCIFLGKAAWPKQKAAEVQPVRTINQ